MCRGLGCDECEDGYFAIAGCPNAYVRRLLPALRLADMYEKGLPPIAGGTLDQAASFIDFVRQLDYEDALVKAEPNA